MKANVGGIDRVVRILVGLALIAWALLGGPVWAWIGIVPLATGVVGFCLVYPIIGFSTSKKSIG
jgi:asparagine N-glycosylation enzyme membrane subunit Stt3